MAALAVHHARGGHLRGAGGLAARLKHHETCLGIALAFVLGGAVGNLYDRVVHGYVVDFFHFHWAGYHFPAFNVADSFITVGAIMLLLDLFMGNEQGDDAPDKGNRQ